MPVQPGRIISPLVAMGAPPRTRRSTIRQPTVTNLTAEYN